MIVVTNLAVYEYRQCPCSLFAFTITLLTSLLQIARCYFRAVKITYCLHLNVLQTSVCHSILLDVFDHQLAFVLTTHLLLTYRQDANFKRIG